MTTSPTISVSEMARFDVDGFVIAGVDADTLSLRTVVAEDEIPLETSVGTILVFLAFLAAGATSTASEVSCCRMRTPRLRNKGKNKDA